MTKRTTRSYRKQKILIKFSDIYGLQFAVNPERVICVHEHILTEEESIGCLENVEHCTNIIMNLQTWMVANTVDEVLSKINGEIFEPAKKPSGVV